MCAHKQIIAAIFVAGLIGSAAIAQPVPSGTTNTSVTWQTDAGTGSASGTPAYAGLPPATIDPTSNFTGFNSQGNTLGVFGRRGAGVLLNNGAHPEWANVIRDGENMVSHAFFKADQSQSWFPNIADDGMITVSVQNIEFDQPAFIDESTLMLHMRWISISEQLDSPYLATDDHYLATDPFRDFDIFQQAGLLTNFPTPNYLNESSLVNWSITGNGTTSLGIEVSFPYSALRNFEEDPLNPQTVPEGLPAPQGFLEPNHFHIEYTVAPEPGTLLLLAGGGFLAMRRKRRGTTR